MLSPKARAFSVDQLLSRRELQQKIQACDTRSDDTKADDDVNYFNSRSEDANFINTRCQEDVNFNFNSRREDLADNFKRRTGDGNVNTRGFLRAEDRFADVADKNSDVDDVCRSMDNDRPCHHRQVTETSDDVGDRVKVELCQGELWQAFHTLGTEMIITKTGRRMFPAVRVRISGLKPHSKYKTAMDFIPVDKNKYRYVYHSSRWMVAGHGDVLKENQTYEHPESPMTGQYLTSQVMSFEKIKLTNNDKPSVGQVSLLSMQKFQPRIVIQELASLSKPIIVTFPQTAFIAVTAYQNQEITRLKIARNPFAKGFREAGKCRSSLEAMMASFGVVIEGNNSHRTSPGKRKLADMAEHDNERMPSPNKYASSWPPTSSVYDQRLAISVPQSSYHNLRANYPDAINSRTGYSKQDVSHNKPEVTNGQQNGSTGVLSQCHDSINGTCDVTADKSGSPEHQHDTDSHISHNIPVPNFIQDNLPSYQICFPTTELHPAFRLYPYAHFPAVVDPHYLNTYYNHNSVSSGLQNLMVVPSGLLPVSVLDHSKPMDFSRDLAHRNEQAVDLCTS